MISPATESTLLGLCVALGVGLLIGAERERSDEMSPLRSAAGIRTFTVTALLGAVAWTVGGLAGFAMAVVVVGGGILLAYQRSRDAHPGMTTEFALLLTCFLGGLALTHPALAAGVGAVLALLLAARQRLHDFVRHVLSEQELHDIILFAALALIVLPLAPNQFMGPLQALNPHALARLVLTVMAIGAAGHVATRWLGPRYGLPLAGFAAGFISSTATIHAMGVRAVHNPAQLGMAVAGAVLSSFATILQMSVVIALVQPSLLLKPALALPLALGGVVTCLYGLVFVLKATRAPNQTYELEQGHAFDLKAALSFTALLSVVLLVSASLNQLLGGAGMLVSAAVTGLADAHATAASAASLLAAGKITSEQTILPILIGLTANTLTKAVVAFNSGAKGYAVQIVPGLVLMVAAVWLGAWLAG